MAVLINCLILCVWQFNSVRPTGLNLPFTSISYKASPINDRSLSLSFSNNDSMDLKNTNSLEDFKTIKNSLSPQEEELSKQTLAVSKVISQVDLISDNNSPMTNYLSKQKQNYDPNILYKEASSPQKNVPNLRTNFNEQYDLPKDLQNKKNTINYNIKVISPPAIFNNPIYLPVTQNVADSKMLSEANLNLKNAPPTFLLPYLVNTPTEKDKQEYTAAWQNVRKIFSNYEDGTKFKIEEPLVQRNTINIADHDVHLIRNMAKTEDIIVPPKENAKCTYDLKINKTPLNMDSRSNNLFDYNCHQIPTKSVDTSYIKNHDILSTTSDIININQEIKPTVSTLSTHATKLSSLNIPEISKPQQIYTRDHDTYNMQLDSPLDNIVSFFKSKFILPNADNSATNSLKMPALLTAPELLQQPTDCSAKFSEKPVSVPTYPEVESPTYLPKPNVDIPLKNINNTTNKSITKSPVPYISSVTINYMPRIESSNEIMIFV